jgi:hypothetical protein
LPFWLLQLAAITQLEVGGEGRNRSKNAVIAGQNYSFLSVDQVISVPAGGNLAYLFGARFGARWRIALINPCHGRS